MHGRKLCAALQAATTGTRPILLRSEGDVGHGARSVSRSIEESADMLAFTARWTGLDVGRREDVAASSS
jgi:prolyl oligopeptidase